MLAWMSGSLVATILVLQLLNYFAGQLGVESALERALTPVPVADQWSRDEGPTRG